MRLLHVVWSAHFSGAEKIVLRTSNEMILRKIVDKVAILFIKDEVNENENLLLNVIDNYQISKTYVSSRNFFNHVSLIKHAVKDFKPDIVHSHDYRATFATRIALSLSFDKKPKHVATIHDAYPFTKNINLKSLIALLILSSPNAIIVVSEGVRKQMWFHKLISKKIKVIPNPYLGNRNIEDLKNARFDKIVNSKEYDLIFVGRLVSKKHPEFFCEVCSKLSAKCAVVGNGELKERLEEKYGNKIKFLGFREDVENLMSKSKFLFLPSEYEGFGLVLIEAMANFCIPIVTPWIGVENIVKHKKTGYIIQWKIETMIQEISKLLSEYDTVSKSMFPNFVDYLKDFSLDSYISKLINVYRNIMSVK